MTGREHGGEVRNPERSRLATPPLAGGSPVAGSVRSPAGVGYPASFARKHAAATAACAAPVNRSPIICADNGTTRSPGSGLVVVRSVRMARATPSFTYRTSFTSPSGFVLLRRTVTRIPSPSVESTTSAQRSALTSLRRHPRHEQQSRDHRVEPPALKGNLLGFDAPPAPSRAMACGEHGRQVRGPEGPRLAPAAITGGPPVAGEHPGGSLTGRARPACELRAEARRGYRHRGARGSAPRVVQLGEVGGQVRVVERAPVEPGVEPPQRPGVSSPWKKSVR